MTNEKVKGIKEIIVVIIAALIVGMGTYIFNRGLVTNENLAVVVTRVAVLEANTLTIKDDVRDIKIAVNAILGGQQKQEKRVVANERKYGRTPNN